MRSWKLLTVVLLLCTCALARESPFSGMWRLTPAKGLPIGPVPRSAIAHVEVNGDNFNFSQEYTDFKGHTKNVSYRAKFDGKDYPVRGDADYDFVSLRRLSDRNIRFTFKKGGTVKLTVDATVSRDGATTTFTYTDYGSGKPHNGVSVYERE
jgi:hypothetical protein